jgi:hypothetical protein
MIGANAMGDGESGMDKNQQDNLKFNLSDLNNPRT